MKKIFLVIGLGLLVGGMAMAQSSRLDQVRKAKELRVCIWPDYYGIIYRSPKTQQLSGIDIDMAGELAKDLGVKLRFVDSSFMRLIDDLSQGHCDIAMFGIGITPQRQQKIKFTSPYLGSGIFAITTRSNRRIQQWADIDQPGVVVAVAKGTYHETVMRETLKSANLLVTDTPQGREQEVESGRADVFMTDYPFSRRMLETTDWARLVAPYEPISPTSYAYATPLGDERWHGRIESFVAAVKADGRLQKAAQRHKLDPIVLLK